MYNILFSTAETFVGRAYNQKDHLQCLCSPPVGQILWLNANLSEPTYTPKICYWLQYYRVTGSADDGKSLNCTAGTGEQQKKKKKTNNEYRTFDAHNVIPDLLRYDRVGYEFDEVVNGVDGRVHALETLDLLADGQRVVGERRRVALVVRRAAAHCSDTSSRYTHITRGAENRLKRSDGPRRGDQTWPR